MVKTNDPMLAVFRSRTDPKVREAYMTKVEAEATARKESGGGKKGKKKAKAEDE